MTPRPQPQVWQSVVIGAVLFIPCRFAHAQDVTAAFRQGIYADSDHTTVFRTLISALAKWRRFSLSANESVDAITSASTDVRSSPFVDATTGASERRRVRSPSMADGRSETDLVLLWHDDSGRSAGGSVVFAAEDDYTSAGGGLQASWDFFQRNTSLFAGLNMSGNQVRSAVDHAFSRALFASGYSVGLTQVLGVRDLMTLRYDGSYLDGYQASPYRAVRFGNWTTTVHPGTDGITFNNTIGPETGAPEQVPGTRLRHAGGVQWVHAVAAPFAVSTQYRIAYDDWGVFAQAASVELRGMLGRRWQGRLSYRFYDQSGTDFWKGRYVLPASAYRFFTADKELGEIVGHSASANAGLAAWERRGGFAALLDAKLEYLRYAYPGFPLLSDRTSIFGELGLRFQF
jgi:hypothetical protein